MAGEHTRLASGRNPRFSVSALQADAAYFGARLALKEGMPPETRYQAAELKAFQTLNQTMIGVLIRLKRGGYSIEPLPGEEQAGPR